MFGRCINVDVVVAIVCASTDHYTVVLVSVRAKFLATSFILVPGSDVTCVLASLVWFIPLRRESPITRSGFCA